MKAVGRYEVIEKLGQGGMGTVYKAFDPLLTRVVAIKVISGQLDSQPENRERFFREARSAAQLSHRNIITIHDLGEQDGAPYLAMEYLEGLDLDKRLQNHEALSLAHKIELALSIGEGIAHAHACGVIHRDIKPANVFVTNEGAVKILDFGLARLTSSELTRSAGMVGTVNYMAPEQLRGEKADHRADIFSFGVLLYELLSGRRPFQGDTAASTMYKILHEAPEPLELIDPALTPPLTTVVERSMAKAREDRYQQMTDLLRDLEAAYEPMRGIERRVGSRVSSALGAPTGSRPAARTPVPISDEALTVSDETVPVDSAWRLAQGSLPDSATAGSGGGSAARAGAAGAGTAWPPWLPVRRAWAVTGLVVLTGLGAVGIYSLTRPSPTAPEPAPATSASPGSSAPAPPPPAEPPPPPAPVPAPAESEPQAGREQPAAAPPSRTTDPERESRAARQAREAALRVERQRAGAALSAMEQVKAAAEQADARQLAGVLFTAAERQEALARDDLRQQRFAAAAGRLDATTTLYRSAESAARAEAEARAARARAAEESRRRAEQQAPKPAPPPAPAPRVEPAAPPAPAGPSAQELIAAVVQRYRSALEQQNLGALKAIWPGLSGPQQSAIEAEFANARTISVELGTPRIQVNGASATVVVRRLYQLRTRDGQQLRSETTTTLHMRHNGAWHIESVRHQPVN